MGKSGVSGMDMLFYPKIGLLTANWERYPYNDRRAEIPFLEKSVVQMTKRLR